MFSKGHLPQYVTPLILLKKTTNTTTLANLDYVTKDDKIVTTILKVSQNFGLNC